MSCLPTTSTTEIDPERVGRPPSKDREREESRYLATFERGTIDDHLIAERLTELRDKSKQLHNRRDDLVLDLANEPAAPRPSTLKAVAEHISEIIANGSHNQTKAPAGWADPGPHACHFGSTVGR